jgi:hypothetical protein
MRRLLFQSVLAIQLLTGCADPFPPLPPPEEVLVVSNQHGSGQCYGPFARGDRRRPRSGFGRPRARAFPVGCSALGSDPRGPTGDADHPLVSGIGPRSSRDCRRFHRLCRERQPGCSFESELPDGGHDRVTTELTVGRYPQGLIFTRGRLFVINGNLTPCGIPPTLCVYRGPGTHGMRMWPATGSST